MAFEKYLETHQKIGSDIWSVETIALVNALYGYEWSEENKTLLAQFTIYVEFNLPTCNMKDSEVAFLIYEYLRFKIHWQKQQTEVEELKKFLTKELDEDNLSHWFHLYHEFKLSTIEGYASLDFLKGELKNEK